MADPLAATLAAIVASQHPATTMPSVQADTPALRDAMYGAQLYDAVNSANFMRSPRSFETDPFMRPFSHGGVPTMLAGFALTDLIRNLALRHASTGTKNLGDILQFLANAQGIAQTNRAK